MWAELHWLAEDCPEGHGADVTRIKEKAHLCNICYYVARGSFGGVKLHDLRGKMDEHEAVMEKFPDWVWQMSRV